MTDEKKIDDKEHVHGPDCAHDHEHGPECDHDHDHAEDTVADGEEPLGKLRQVVEIKDAGPCKKHIKVTVNREDIDARFDEKYTEIVRNNDEPMLRGFRPGKAPRKLIERFYKREVSNQVKGEVLMASLEQLADENDVAPLSPPNLDPRKLEIPDQGDFIYEFEVEVRPQFDLPNYKGLKLKRPVQKFTDVDIQVALNRLLEPDGQIVPKKAAPGEPAATADIGDFVIADVITRLGTRQLNEMKEVQVRVETQLALKDGVAATFGEQMKGAKAGDERVIEISLSDTVSDPELRGQTVHATFKILDVKALRLPDLTPYLLMKYGVHNEEQLKELLRLALERRLEYQQRQSARAQVLAQIAEAQKWELPQDLLRRQARSSLNRRITEMRAAGMADNEIQGRLRLLQQDVLRTTEMELKEHFVMQKIAEVEKLDVTEDDIVDEIERIADRTNESPRRIRARLEREDMLEALATELVERKALDLILAEAEYEDVVVGADTAAPVATVEAQAVPGELNEPTAPPVDEPNAEDEIKDDAGAPST